MIRDGFFLKLPIHSVLPDTAKVIKKELSYDAPGKEHSKAFLERRWDGKYYLFSAAHGFYKFPYGLVERVAKYLPIEVTRTLPEVSQSDEWTGHKLHEDQALGVSACLNTDRGIVVHPTGSGKMTLISSLTNQLGNYRVLILCFYSKAVKDTYNELVKSGVSKVQILGKTTKSNPLKSEDARVVVATHAAFLRGLVTKRAGDFNVILVDEAEMFASAKNYKMIQLTNPKFLYGFTATPYRTDGRDILIHAVFGEIISELKHEKAVEKGILFNTQVFALRQNLITDEFDVNVNIKQYQPHHRQRISYWLNRDRNLKIIQLNHLLTDLGLTHLILTNSTEHVGELFKLGLKAEPYIRDDYSGVIDRLDKKEILAIVSTKANRSINIPSLEAVIDTSVAFNANLLVQRHGRVTRPGKKRGYYIMFLDTFQEGYTKKVRIFKNIKVKVSIEREISKLCQTLTTLEVS